MTTSCIFIGEQRRAAARRFHALVAILLAGVLLACLVIASNADYAEADRQEQATADIACRAAGADKAVRVELLDGSRSIFICNRPAPLKQALRKAVMRRAVR